MSKETKQRHNVVYENEFPALSEISAKNDVQASTDSFSYSAKLRKPSQEHIGKGVNKRSKISLQNTDCCTTSNITNSDGSVTHSSKSVKCFDTSNKNISLQTEISCINTFNSNNKCDKFKPTSTSATETNNVTFRHNDIETGWKLVGKKGPNPKYVKNDRPDQCDSRVEIHASVSSYSNLNKPSGSYSTRINPGQNTNKKIINVASSKVKLQNQNTFNLNRHKKLNVIQNGMENSDESKKDFRKKSGNIKSIQNFSERNHTSVLPNNNHTDNGKNIKKTFHSVQDSGNQSNGYSKKDNKNQFSKKQNKTNVSQENKYPRVKLSDSALGKKNFDQNHGRLKKMGHDTQTNLHQSNKKTLSFDGVHNHQQSSQPAKNCTVSQENSNIENEVGYSNPFKSSRKKRKSKIKRQAAIQSNKIQIISAEIHRKIVNQDKLETVPSQNMLSNIYDSEEYPELSKVISSCKSGNADEFSLKRKFKDISNDKVCKIEDDQLISEFSSDVTAQGKLCESTEKIQESVECEKVPVHSSNPLSVSLFDMLLANKNKKKNPEKGQLTTEHSLSKAKIKKHSSSNINHQVVNPLDSSKPAVKRGKERENPKLKKPSLLKKIILQDRERRKARLLHKCEKNEMEQNKVDFFDVNDQQSQYDQAPDVSFSSLENCSDSLDSYLSDIRWLFGLSGKCFHRISRKKCTICDENEIIEDGILVCLPLLFETRQQTSFYKKMHKFQDSVLSDIRRLFRNDAEAKNLSNDLSESFIDDIKYLFDDGHNLEADSNRSVVSLDKNILNNCNNLSKNNNDLNIANGEEKIDNFSKEIFSDILLSSDGKAHTLRDLENTQSFNKELLVASQIAIHSKKFREYCNHFLNKDLEDAVFALIDDLARFQDRMHQKDPVKARMKRRLLYGIREIKRHMKLKKLKCIIIASDIENSGSEGGLNDNIKELKALSKDFQIPCIFALQRRKLGRVCRKPSPVSAIGVINYEGSEGNFKKMLSVQNECKMDYAKVITSLSSNLTIEQAALLFKTKEENSSELHSVIITLLKDIFPKPVNVPIDNLSNIGGEKMYSLNKEKWVFPLLDGDRDCNLKDTISLMNQNNAEVIENYPCSKNEIYNILTKYKIINY